MRMPALAVALLLLASCKSIADRLREEGYENVREMTPLVPCPSERPDLDESFVAERGGKAWEIIFCCRTETHTVVEACLGFDGKPSVCIGPETTRDCQRYVRALDAER